MQLGQGSDPLAHAREMARNIARSSPDAIRAAKRLLNRSSDDDAAALLVSESREQERLMGSPNQIEAVRAGMEQRPPAFGRSPAGRVTQCRHFCRTLSNVNVGMRTVTETVLPFLRLNVYSRSRSTA